MSLIKPKSNESVESDGRWETAWFKSPPHPSVSLCLFPDLLTHPPQFIRCVHILSCFSCIRLCNPMNYSLPGSSAHGILHTRILEWVAMLSYRGSSRPRNGTSVSHVSCIGRQVLLPLAFFYHLGIRKTEIATKVLTDSTFLRPQKFSEDAGPINEFREFRFFLGCWTQRKQ